MGYKYRTMNNNKEDNKNNNRKNAGRKIFDGKNPEIVLQKLEQVWSLGGSDLAAASYADISVGALSDYLKKHPEISERKELFKQRPILKALKSVFDGLDDPDLAMKYLERKLPNEYAPQQKIEHSSDALTLTKIIQIVNGNRENGKDIDSKRNGTSDNNSR